MIIDAWSLPHDVAAGAELATLHDSDGVLVRAPLLTPRDIDHVCDALSAAQRRLASVPVDDVVAAIDSAARRIRDPAEPARNQVLRSLCGVTGYAPAMAAAVLDRMSEDWLEPALRALLDAELGGAAALEGWVDRVGVRTRAMGLPLGLHVFSGNVPGVNVTSMVRALLVRSAVLGKSASGEPVLAPVFARLLAEADPRVADCLAVTYWRGGDHHLETAALARVDMVVHYGAADALASLRSRAPARVRFVEHGPRVSCAVVRAGSGDATRALLAAAKDAARAVALFDQQGCVSPQFVCVVGGAGHARTFAAALATALEQIEAELPRGSMDAGEAAAVHALRTSAEFRGIAGESVDLWTGDGLAWTVICEPDAPFSGSCLNRTVTVHAAPDLEDLLERMAPISAFIQTVGVAGFDPAEREDLAMRLGAIGATRITAIAAMPWPPPAWHHDGSGPLRELVRWVDLES